MLGWDTAAYAARARAFGWRAIEINGHDLHAIDRAYAQALTPDGRPTAIFARTVKGKGVAAIENRNGFHGKPLAEPDAAIAELGGTRQLVVPPQRPAASPAAPPPRRTTVQLPSWSPGQFVATRRAYGEALRAVGAADPRVVAMDGEVGNSTYSHLFRDAFPERYFEMYVAEQQMVAAAIGLQARGWIPFSSTFAAFWTRAHDFVRMAAGGSRTLRSSSHDDVTLLAAGITVHESLAAADALAAKGIRARVIDLYSVKPLDAAAVTEAARDTGNLIITEDHWASGGVADAVLEALADTDSYARVRRLAVHEMPTSGRPEELLSRSGIDRTWIATAAGDLLEDAPTRHLRRHRHRSPAHHS